MKILKTMPTCDPSYELEEAKSLLIDALLKLENMKGATQHVNHLDRIIIKLEHFQHFIAD